MKSQVDAITSLDSRTEQLGKALALAFQHEPNFTFILRNRDRMRPLEWFFGSFVTRLGLQYGRVYATDGRSGGAVWMSPRSSVSPWGALKIGVLSMPFRFGVAGARRSLALGAHIEKVRKEVAPRSHWYLAALGVHPEMHGRGIGTALLKPVLEEADRGERPCYLETFRERTTNFYQRVGFEITHRGEVPGGPPFWCMVREARP